MKTRYVNQHSTTLHGLLPALAGFALFAILFSAPLAPAQNLIVDSFDNAASVGLYNTPGIAWDNLDPSYVVNGCTIAWDPNQQSPGNPNPGALYFTIEWPLVTDPQWNETGWNNVQLAFNTPGTFDATKYISFDFDLKVDVTNSSVAIDGSSYGAVGLYINGPWVQLVGWAWVAPIGDWQHFSGYFTGVSGSSYNNAVIGFISTGGDSLTNTVSYWIDNVVFTAPPTSNTNQPTLSIAQAPPPGLTCLCTSPGGTWQRQYVETVHDDYSWVTSTLGGDAVANTTTYSMTIASFPEASYSTFAAQMFLIPVAGMIGLPQDDDIDWDSADVVDLYINANPNGTANGIFQYKVNQSSSWNTSLIVTNVCSTGPLGTWSLTFSNNTNVTVTAPDSNSVSFTIPVADAGDFVDPLYVYLGSQPNENANIGQQATFGKFTITGAAGSINDNFATDDGTLNAAVWANDTAVDTNGIFMTAPDAKYWVTWPTPDGGFTNVYATDNLTNKLGSSQWLSLPSASTGWVLVNGAQRLTVINQSTLNTAFGYQPTNCFFGLWHQ